MKYEGKSVRHVVQAIDPSPYLDLLDERFGIEPVTFEPYLFFQPKRDSVWMVARHLLLPGRPEPYSLGAPFFRIRMRYPRPSTSTVFRFGALARRNVLTLREEEIPAAIYHRPLALSPERAALLDGNGYVILRYEGLDLGLGYYRPEGEGGLLTSLCPKAWTRRLGIEPPARLPPPWAENGDGADHEGDRGHGPTPS